MSSGDPRKPGDGRSRSIKRQIAVLQFVERGIVSALRCPACEQVAGEVWFSNVADEYRIWFLCAECGHGFSAQTDERPSAFTEDRVSPRCQALHEDLRRNRKFGPPDT